MCLFVLFLRYHPGIQICSKFCNDSNNKDCAKSSAYCCDGQEMLNMAVEELTNDSLNSCFVILSPHLGKTNKQNKCFSGRTTMVRVLTPSPSPLDISNSFLSGVFYVNFVL